jgi:hypothetical protein
VTTVELRIERLERAAYDGVTLEPGAPRHRVDLAIVPCFEDERPLRGLAALLDWRTAGSLSRLLREGFCSGATSELVLMPARADLPCDRVVLLGLGMRDQLHAEAARRVAASAVAVAHRLAPADVLFALPSDTDRELVEALFSGLVVALGGASHVASHGDAGGDAGRDATRDGDAPDDAASGVPWLMRPATPDPGDAEPPVRWWIVADGRHAGRLRRLLDGPPRAAAP